MRAEIRWDESRDDMRDESRVESRDKRSEPSRDKMIRSEMRAEKNELALADQ